MYGLRSRLIIFLRGRRMGVVVGVAGRDWRVWGKKFRKRRIVFSIGRMLRYSIRESWVNGYNTSKKTNKLNKNFHPPSPSAPNS